MPKPADFSVIGFDGDTFSPARTHQAGTSLCGTFTSGAIPQLHETDNRICRLTYLTMERALSARRLIPSSIRRCMRKWGICISITL